MCVSLDHLQEVKDLITVSIVKQGRFSQTLRAHIVLIAILENMLQVGACLSVWHVRLDDIPTI
jgi:hypothetical protein